MGRDSLVGIAIRYCLYYGSNHGGGEVFRIGPDRPRDPYVLLYSGYWVFVPEVEAAGPWLWAPTPSSNEAEEIVELYLNSLQWAFLDGYRVKFTCFVFKKLTIGTLRRGFFNAHSE